MVGHLLQNSRNIYFHIQQKKIFVFKASFYTQQLYINSSKLYPFKELYSFQGNYIRSRKLYSLKEIHSFKEIIFIQ